MRRSFAIDVLQCPTCAGRLRVRGDITEPTLVRQVLERLGIPWEAPRIARARDPTLLVADETAD